MEGTLTIVRIEAHVVWASIAILTLLLLLKTWFKNGRKTNSSSSEASGISSLPELLLLKSLQYQNTVPVTLGLHHIVMVS